jgi:TonB-dependent heme/hemoglobin receptor
MFSDRANGTSSRAIPQSRILGAALVLLLAATATAGAEERDRGNADTLKKVVFLRETVVTGARYPRAYYESPQALSFVSRTQLLEQAPTAVGDVLQGLPGVDNSKDSPWEQRPVLRGLAGQRVLVLMDGSPMNSARGNGPHPSLLDPAQVERIEVVRGPSSVAYGSDALGGVINIITRQAHFASPEQSFRGSATVGGSTADRQRNGYLELMPRIGRLSALISGGGRRSEDFESPNGKVPDSGFSDYNALANLGYELSNHLALKGSYQLYRGSDIGIPGLSFAVPGFLQKFSFPEYDRDAAHLTLEHAYPQAWLSTALVRIYWQREHRNFFSHEDADVTMLPPGPPPPAGAQRQVTDQSRFFDLDTYGFQTQFTSLKTRHYRVSAGVDLTRDKTDGDNVRYRTFYDAAGSPVGSTSKRVTASVPDGRFDNYGTFAQSEWYPHPRWTLSAGGRYTHYRYRTGAGPNVTGFPFAPRSVDDDALSGSAGLVYTPLTDLHVTANVANGYRHPNAQDLFFSGPASVGFVLGNPDLESEKSVSYDAGLRWAPGGLALSGDVFYSTYRDLIDAVAVVSPPQASGQPAYRYTNIAEARIWGAEAQGEWAFHPRWVARSALSYSIGDITSRDAIRTLYGVERDRAPLPNVPPFKGSVGLRWQDARNRFWVEPGARWSWRTSRLPLPVPGVPQPNEFKKEWVVGDLFAGARFPSGQRLIVGVRNFTDRAYRQALASLVDPGISVVVSLSTEF